MWWKLTQTLEKNTIDGGQIFLAPQQINVPWRGGREVRERFFKNDYLVKSCLVLHVVTPTVSLWGPEMNRKVLFMSHYPSLPPSIAAPLTQRLRPKRQKISILIIKLPGEKGEES